MALIRLMENAHKSSNQKSFPQDKNGKIPIKPIINVEKNIFLKNKNIYSTDLIKLYTEVKIPNKSPINCPQGEAINA